MSRTTRRLIGYVALVGLLVSAVLSGGDIFYQVTGHSAHAHVGLTGWQATLPLVTDVVGLVLALLLAAQLMVGYRLFAVPAIRFRSVHVALAWTLVTLLALHATAGVVHTLSAPFEVLPVWIDVIGATVVALVALQLTSGYRRPVSRAARLRAVHLVVAIPIALVASGHVVLAVVHTLMG